MIHRPQFDLEKKGKKGEKKKKLPTYGPYGNLVMKSLNKHLFF